MAYQIASTTLTLNDLEGHSPVAGLFKFNASNVCATFCTISTDSVLAQFLCISRASCTVLTDGAYETYANNCMATSVIGRAVIGQCI